MNDMLNQLESILTLSATALTFCCCIVVGYCLRIIHRFPNDGIPIAVILTGALAMVLLADNRDPGVLFRAWVTRYIIVGLIIGFISWMAHKLVISKIEDYLATKFDVVARVLNIKSTQPPASDPKP